MPTLTIDNQVSPRIITVDAPDTQITVQELVDLLRDWEDDSINADDDQIVSAAGKENLGGGVSVGISATLQDAQLAFEARVLPLEEGTVTTAGSNGRTLIDTSATFQTNNVGRGDLVYNVTDGSQCSVVSVDSETQLTTTLLIGGTENDYDVADSYVVYDVVQCSVSGGNLVAVDSNQSDINVIFPTFGTQIVRTSSSSATLQNQAQLEYSTFGGGVSVDVVTGVSGTEFPIGTPGTPVDNLADAIIIANSRGFKDFFIRESMTITGSDLSSGFTFTGRSQLSVTLTINPGSNVDNCIFKNMTITGTLDNGNRLENCLILTVQSFDGFIQHCGITTGIFLGGSSQTDLIDCYSNVAGSSTPFVDVGSGSALAVRNWNGGIELRNKTGNDPISFDMSSGQVILASTITNGDVIIRGVGKLINNATGTANIVEELLDSRNLNKPVFVDGAVHFDSTAASSGTAFPFGTPSQPVNDLADAISIASTQGLKRISFEGFATATASHNLDDLELFGGTGSSNVLNLNGCSTNQSAFSRLIVYGTLNGLSRITNCILGTTGLGGITEVEGRVVDCIINHTDGIIQKATGAGTLFDNCAFIAPNDPQITINANGKGLSLRKCTGNILLTNKTDAETDQINLQGARLEIASSCTAGSFIITGHGSLTDNSGATSVTDLLDSTKITELHELEGLVSGNPMTVTPSARSTANLSLVLTGDGTTTKTVTRS